MSHGTAHCTTQAIRPLATLICVLPRWLLAFLALARAVAAFCLPSLLRLVWPVCHACAHSQVKYPASQDSKAARSQGLPLGLTGKHFSAMFGTNQSMLEALTLKSHLMGPGWLTVRRPRRVAAEKQVCCGLSGRWLLHGCVHACMHVAGWRLAVGRTCRLGVVQEEGSLVASCGTTDLHIAWLCACASLQPTSWCVSPSQLTWCKLEVEVDSHKAVAGCPADSR